MRRVAIAAAWILLTTNAWAQLGVPQTPTGEPSEGTTPVSPTGDDMFPLPLGQRRTDQSTPISLPPMSGPVDAATYQLGPGDILRLQMWGRVSSTTTLQVGPEGAMIVPGVGTIQVARRSLADVRKELISRLQGRFRGVNIDLRLARPRTFYVYLTGQVRNPGPVVVTAANRVFDVLSPSQFQENGSQRRIEVRHNDETREIADLDLFTLIGDRSLNPYLRDGDVIQVPIATEFIYAAGALARAGRYELGQRDSLRTLFRLAGDPIPAADVNRALLVSWRDPESADSVTVRLDDVYEGRYNPALREGDRLYVYYLPGYHEQNEAYIYGEVNRPGPYPIQEGRHRLSHLVLAAGGFRPNADLSAIRVIRRSPGASEKDPELERLLRLSRDQLTISEYDALNTKLAALREGYRVDWNRLQASPQELDILLRAGDIVRVERLVNSIRVDGAVRRPGILSFRAGLSISDYVRQAGGYTDRAWRGRVQVTRTVTGQTLPARNVPTLHPGDFVWVPEKPDRTAWEGARDVLSALGQIATVIIAIRSLR